MIYQKNDFLCFSTSLAWKFDSGLDRPRGRHFSASRQRSAANSASFGLFSRLSLGECFDFSILGSIFGVLIGGVLRLLYSGDIMEPLTLGVLGIPHGGGHFQFKPTGIILGFSLEG